MSEPTRTTADPHGGRRRSARVAAGALIAAALLLGGACTTTESSEPEEEQSTTTSEPTTAVPETMPAVAAPLEHPVAPTGDAAFDDNMTQIARFVEETRGHPFKESVKVDLVSEEKFNELLLEDFDSGASDLEKTAVAFRALGLIPGGADLAEALRAALSGGVLGFYDPKTDELVVRGLELTPFLEETIAHELTHALDDQWFGLDRPELDDAEDETGFAFSALTEGTASWVENAWAATRSDEEQNQYDDEMASFGSDVDYSNIPLILLEMLDAPYSYGSDFVDAVTADGGVEALDDAFREPPVSSEQIMHPDLYLSGDVPMAVAIPPADGSALDQGTFGELTLRSTLVPDLGASRARDASEGWGGDAYVVWTTPDGASCLRLDLVADTPKDADEIAEIVGDWAAAQPGATTSEVSPGTTRLTTCR